MGEFLSWYALSVFSVALLIIGLLNAVGGVRRNWRVRYENKDGEVFYSTLMTRRDAQDLAFIFNGTAEKE